MYNGSWVDQGFPHYSGHASYTQKFSMDCVRDNCRYYVHAEAFGGPVAVSINGCEPSVAIAEPFDVDVSDMIRDGINSITIETANTAENFFYDLRVPAGISKPVVIIEEQIG